MRVLLLLLAVAAGSTLHVRDQVKVGSLRFMPPEGWKAAAESGPAAAIYSPAKLPSGKTCLVKVFPEEFDKDGFREWFNRRWSRTVTGAQQVLRTSELSSQKIEGVETLMRSAAYKIGTGEGYIFSIGLSVEGKFICVSYEANDYALMEKHQAEVYDMFDTFHLVEGEPTSPNKPAVTNPAVGPKPGVSAPSTIPTSGVSGGRLPSDLPRMRSRAHFTIPATLPQGLPMPAGTPDQAAAILAKMVAAYNLESLPALVTAVRASGFTIRTPDRKLIASHLSPIKNGIFVEDAELLTFFAMTCRGDSVSAAGLMDSVDFILAKTKAQIRMTDLFPATLAKCLDSKVPGPRFFARFLVEIGKALPQGYDLSKFQVGSQARITPIEAFLILRTFSEELRMEALFAKKKLSEKSDLKAHGPVDLFLTGDRRQTDLSSYLEFDALETKTDVAQDAHAFISTWSVSELLKALDMGTLGTVLNGVNLAASFAKFISTYYCLEAKFSVASPGEPLIRTKSMSQNGERRTLNAEIYMKTPELLRLLKEHRKHLSQSGVDFDMPKPGKMAKAGVRWRLLGYTGMNTNDKPVQFVGSNIEETETDANGVAHVDIEGTRQRLPIPSTSPPVKYQVPISVMVQVKGIEMSQDLLDAFTASVGLGGENPFWAVPGVIQEMIFRAKIAVNGTLDLKFVDWKPGSLKAAYSIHVSGSGSFGSQGDKTSWSVDRTYMSSGWLVAQPGAFNPPVAKELDKTPGTSSVFRYERKEDHWSVKDREVSDSKQQCDNSHVFVVHEEETFNGPLGDERGHPANNVQMDYAYDYATRKMFIGIRQPSLDGNHRVYRTVDGKVTRNVNEDIGFGMFPRGMSEIVTSGRPIGQGVVEYQDPSELPEGEAITGEFRYKQPYKFKGSILLLEYKFVIKPQFDGEDLIALRPAPKQDGTLLALLRELSLTEPVADEDELASCYPTTLATIASLSHQRASKH